MLTYKEVEFTEELIQEIISTVAKAADVAVLKYVSKHKELLKGFQIKKIGGATFRKKVGHFIISKREMDDDAVDLLYSSGVGQEFVTVLSDFALIMLRDQFAAILGRAAFTLALLLDPRDEIHELGCEMLKNGKERELDKETASEVVVECMQSFITHFSSITSVVPIQIPPPIKQDPAKNIQVERELKAEHRRNTELGSQLKAEKQKAELQLAEKAERIEKLLTERNMLRSSTTELKSRIESLQDELKGLRLTFDTDVTASVESRLEGLTNGWLKVRVQHEQKLNRQDHVTDLLSQADDVIKQQVQADRHTGNRSELKKRLSAISGKLAEVRDIRANALQPIDELSGIESQLFAEEGNLSRLLGSDEDSKKSPMVQALAARINSASEGENIQNLELFLEELHQLGLPDSDFGFLQNKLGEWYDRLLSLNDSDRPLLQLPLNPALRFRFALGQGDPLTLVCDGHNILNSMDFFKDVRNRSHSDARKSLSDTITGLMKPYGCCTTTIVYDGTDHNKIECSDNVTVIYSGGGKSEKHRADRRIEELLNWREYTGRSAPVFVVTADYDLGQEARKSGAEVIPLDHFEWMLAGA